MKKRLFFALTIPQRFKQELTTTLLKFDILNTLSSASPRIVKPENLHITMLFLASVDEKLIPGLIKLGEQICLDIKAFSLKLKDISLAPPGQKPRMIWAVFAENHSFTKISIKNSALSFTSLVLMESTLAKSGAQYQILAVMPFDI